MNSFPQPQINPEKTRLIPKGISRLLQRPQYSFVKESVTFLKKYMTPQHFENLYLSFNGGKDATVVLYLTLLAMQDTMIESKSIKCIYFREPEPFEEVDRFINEIRNKFCLKWNELPSKKYQQELKTFSQVNKLQYVIMGSRKDDPYCDKLGMQAPSDVHKGYPSFVRLNPIIYWEYDQVWTFIKNFRVPYCSLYDDGTNPFDEGYTYLGNKSNTTKNPVLYDPTSNNFKKAYQAPSQAEKASRTSLNPTVNNALQT